MNLLSEEQIHTLLIQEYSQGQIVTRIINGEIISTSSQNISVFEKEPLYVKLYLEDIGRLNNLNSSEQ